MSGESVMELLMWARGPGFTIAVTVFLFGMLLRLMEILLLGRKNDLAPPRRDPVGAGVRTIFTRFLPAPGMMRAQPTTIVGGYLFHVGFFVVLFFFVPHIQVFKETLGLEWPGLPTPAIDAATVLAMAAMIAVLAARLRDPVRRMLSGPQDYVLWALTFIPLLTGYLAVNQLLLPYAVMLGLHILAVELLMVAFPFTRLTHAVTFILARYYTGWNNGRKGAPT